MMALRLLLSLMLVSLASAGIEKLVRGSGYCSIYGNCGKKSVFGASLPCLNNTKAVMPSQESVDILTRVCGPDFPTENGLCCSYDQLVNLELNLKKAAPLIGSCPACQKNFQDFFCNFVCLSDQSTFVEITKSQPAIDTQLDIVTEMTLYTDPEYAESLFESCKNIKFSATNGYAMDLIGGGAKNYSQFLKFLGDEKPLLGGSPFQINHQFELSQDSKPGLKLSKENTFSCDDAVYKCACSDCPQSCPVLPGFKPFNYRCNIVGVPCFSAVVAVIWVTIFAIIGFYHVRLVNTKAQQLNELNRLLEGDESDLDDLSQSNEELSDPPTESPTNLYYLKVCFYYESVRQAFLALIETRLKRLAYFCAFNPVKTISLSLGLSLLACSGIRKIEWESDPIKLWVSENEPALKNLRYFEENFGEWYRIEQIIISNKHSSEPVLNWETLQWWFHKEMEIQEFTIENNTTVSLNDFCFKPLGEACAIESFTQYFQGDLENLNEANWAQELTSCTLSPVNCLPTFQQPLKPNFLFSSDDPLKARAFIVTLLLNSNLTDSGYTALAKVYEKELQKWLKRTSLENPDLNIAFSTEISLEEELNQSSNTDVNIIFLSYFAMFIYVSVALGGRIPTSLRKPNFVSTRFQLGLVGVLVIALAVCASAGLCAYIGIRSTLIIAEVIPFLVLAVGVDNIFLIVHELEAVSTSYTISGNSPPVEARVSEAISSIGPSCFMSFVLQACMFLLSSTVEMPAVRNFALYSTGAILINFILQMTLFVLILTIDQKRIEDKRLDFAPWVQVDTGISLDEDRKEYIEYNLALFMRDSYSPWLLKASIKRKVFAFFLLWLGVSLSLLPNITLGLDQRLAIPSGSYLVEYFNSVYEYLNVGPPIFFVVKDLDVRKRENQQKLCGKFSTCDEFSVANVLEQEYKRGEISSIAEPASNWLDTFFNWLNPDLDQCCRFKKSAPGVEFCSPFASPRQCLPCFVDHDPPYNILMEGLPTDEEFMKFFNQWILEPSDPCPLGGKAPYGTSVSYRSDFIRSSYLRSSHKPLRSQKDFIMAYENALRIVEEIRLTSLDGTEVFAFSPFYVFFVQYETIIKLTFVLLTIAVLIILLVSTFLLGLFRTALLSTGTVAAVVANIGGIMSLWNISLNAVSLVNIIICVGLAVEFTVHITKAYLSARKSTNEDTYTEFMTLDIDADYKDTKTIWASKALGRVGGPVLGGITITKLIGIIVLAYAQSQIFEVFYFRMWLSLVAIASMHALMLLPVLLSMFGEA